MSDNQGARHQPNSRPRRRRSPAIPESGRSVAAAREFLRAVRADLTGLVQRARLRPRRPRKPGGAPRPRPSAAWRFFRSATIAVAAIAASASVAITGTMLWALHDLPFDAAEANPHSEPTILLTAEDGSPLGRIGRLQMADASLAEYPEHLIDAVLSIEDRRFYSHWGIDPRGIARALRRNFAAGTIMEGGSTITQQLVKMQILGGERTYTRKVREAFAAVWLERRLGKSEILARYLNRVYLGSSAHGMPAAARLYFDKGVSELALAESALLAGLIRAPSQYNPLQALGTARERAAIVLRAMVANGAIDEHAAEQAIAEPARLNQPQMASEAESWFAGWAGAQAIARTGPVNDSLVVRTTLVPGLQKLAEEAVREGLKGVGTDKSVGQAALIAMRPDGAVVAMVGGRDYDASQFNRATQALRQPGSAFKLFVYLAALRNGYQLEDMVVDAPLDVDGWQPQNFGGEYAGEVTLIEAFARSINTVAVQLALAVGLDEVSAAARDLGIDAPLKKHPSLALGASEVSLLDLTAAYASVRTGRAPTEPWGIAALGREGEARLYATGPPVEPRESLEPYREPLLRLLQSAVDRGTARQAALGRFTAGKTGTSQNHRDAWFIGFDENLVVGVWAGNDDGAPMDAVTGGSLPALIFKAFMTRAGTLAAETREDPSEELDAEAAEASLDWVFQPFVGERPPAHCNYRACARTYRSFRASDCSYQPYGGGPRAICDMEDAGIAAQPLAEANPTPADSIAAPADATPAAADLRPIPAETNPAPVGEVALLCDVDACSERYQSFRASDCSYRPLDGGPRQQCDIVLLTNERQDFPETQPRALAEESAQSASGLCDVSACAAQYESFRASDCTYQPFGGGPRRLCTP